MIHLPAINVTLPRGNRRLIWLDTIVISISDAASKLKNSDDNIMDKPNVIFIINESLSRRHLYSEKGRDIAPFFHSLMQDEDVIEFTRLFQIPPKAFDVRLTCTKEPQELLDSRIMLHPPCSLEELWFQIREKTER